MKVVATVLLGPGAEKHVQAAIQSAMPHVDAFVFVDSGGGESAVTAALAVGRARPFCLTTFDWCEDYAAARNFALDKAQEYGADWALTVDPDERIELPQVDTRQRLEREGVDVWAAWSKSWNYLKPRFIAPDSGCRWRGACCEILAPTGRHGILLGCFDELEKDEEGEAERARRGAEKMPAEIDRDPRNPHWRRHLGHCLLRLGEFRSAELAFRGILALEDSPLDARIWAAYKAAQCCLMLGRETRAENYVRDYMPLSASFLQEWASILAHTRCRLGDATNGARWAACGLTLRSDPTRLYPRDECAEANLREVLAAWKGASDG